MSLSSGQTLQGHSSVLQAQHHHAMGTMQVTTKQTMQRQSHVFLGEWRKEKALMPVMGAKCISLGASK